MPRKQIIAVVIKYSHKKSYDTVCIFPGFLDKLVMTCDQILKYFVVEGAS